MSGSISIIRASVRQGEPRVSEFTFRSVSSPSQSPRIRAGCPPRILPGYEVTRDRLFDVSVGIFWNLRRRGVSVECSRSRRSHGRPEVRSSSSQRVPIFAEDETHPVQGIFRRFTSESFTTVFPRRTRNRALSTRRETQETSSLPSGRKQRCVFFTQRPGKLLENTSASRIGENGEHFGDRKDEVREIPRSSNGLTFDRQASFGARSWNLTTRLTRWRTRLPDRHRRRSINGNLELGWNRPRSV